MIRPGGAHLSADTCSTPRTADIAGKRQTELSQSVSRGRALLTYCERRIAESGVDRGSDSGVEVEARIGSYVRSSQCRIDPSNGQSPVV